MIEANHVNVGDVYIDAAGSELGTVFDTLYGETYQGGYDNLGAVFSFDLSNSVYSQTHSFSGYDAINPGAGDGSSPYATLVEDSNGLLFGTTATGGGYGSGVVYSITNTGSAINYLYSFSY